MSDPQRTVVILGATGAIGSEVARRLAAQGAELYLGGRDTKGLDTLRRELNASGARIDARQPESIEALVAKAAETTGRLDGLVNCVGSILLKPAHLTRWEEWDETVAVNLGTCFAALRAAVRPMMPTGGSIVFVSTAAARTGLANHEAIAAAKAGIHGLVRAAAASYGSRSIRVNAVAPGLVRTPLSKRITDNPDALEVSESMHVLRRIGEPGEVASLITWLLDPANGWVTGQIMGVDGGLATVRPRG